MVANREMCKMINAIENEDQGWIARIICDQPRQYPDNIVREVMWQALRQAEDNGRRYNGIGCIKWVIGDNWAMNDYVVTCITEDPDFCAKMLTEESMDRLIIGGL